MSGIALGRTATASLGDRYIPVLALGLLGYAALGKGFAYLGLPPLFIGEILLGFGLLALWQAGTLPAVFTALPNLLLAAMAAWVAARTLPFLGRHGVDALRDSVIILYGAFGVIVCGLILERPERLNRIFRLFAGFAAWYGPGGWTLYYLGKVARNIGVGWPGSGMPLIAIRPGEVAVHVAGSAVFALLFFGRTGLLRSALLLMSIAMVSAQSRGGMLAILLPLGVACLVSGRLAGMLRMGAIGAALLAGAYMAQIEVSLPPDNRVISAEQLLMNAASIVGAPGEGDLDGTKLWRLRWWEAIRNYTLHGPLFWTGQGFGMNLAEEDGFVVGLEHGGAVVRSPHNASMTILARAGVPGLALWALLLAAWLGMMAMNILEARLAGEPRWADWFLFLACYLAAAVIDASFDVALEGPMLGIWFWTIFGIGVGSSMVFRARGRAA